MDQESQNWSKLIGKDGAEAVETIKRESDLTNVQIVPPNSMVTMDYRTDRIRVHVNEQGKVTSAPTVG